jgi:hypothetical protein
MTTPTSIVPAQNDLRKVVQSGLISYNDLLERLAKPAEEVAQEETPAQPTEVVLADTDRKALRTFAAQVSELQLPSGKRELTVEERRSMLPIFEQAKAVKAAAERVEGAIKVTFHNHIDLTTPDAPRDKNGHKLIEGEVAAPGYPNKAVRDVKGGGALHLTEEDLADMRDAGLITRGEYLRSTQKVEDRVLVPDAFMRVVQARPELVDVIAKYAHRSPKSTAIRMAKA